ncbi:MAG: phosphomethylpyrimidine synthase ThiC, partial [Acidobacteriota bacterium]|nr:phosphomethylpyrimidine synthase ThiC [Acidobacteriota bacterium]
MKAAVKHLEIDLTTGPLPASRKIFVQGNLHKDVYVPLREISLSSQSQEQPLHVYDSSGPYTDTDVVQDLTIEEGLPRLREARIRARGEVAE